MALTKETVVDQITVTEQGTILIREVTRIMENDVEISKTYHRTSVNPGDNISNQDQKVQTIANAIWTNEVISAYQSNLTRTQV
tara:strand:- start:2576 stop:2824 length:249 start_codon:yes stop_codon:yes gene_type:complete